jgi:hypothetical protein
MLERVTDERDELHNENIELRRMNDLHVAQNARDACELAALQEYLDEAVKFWSESVQRARKWIDGSAPMQEIAQLIDDYNAKNARVAELEAAARWVSVDERLPDEGQFVFVYCRSLDAVLAGQFADTFNGPQGFTDLGRDYFDEGDVTHWRELPAPPAHSSTKENPNERIVVPCGFTRPMERKRTRRCCCQKRGGLFNSLRRLFDGKKEPTCLCHRRLRTRRRRKTRMIKTTSAAPKAKPAKANRFAARWIRFRFPTATFYSARSSITRPLKTGLFSRCPFRQSAPIHGFTGARKVKSSRNTKPISMNCDCAD